MKLHIYLGVLAMLVAGCSQSSNSEKFDEYHGKPNPSCTAARISNQFIVTWSDGRITVESSKDADTFISEFMEPHSEKITHVDFDKVIRTADLTFKSSSLSNIDPMYGQNLIEAPAVWNLGIKGKGVTVAVVDSGIDYYHPKMFSQLAENKFERAGKQLVDDDNNGLIDDEYGWDFFENLPTPKLTADTDHGTHVAGIVAAAEDGEFMTGVAPEAKILPANFMDSSGNGTLSAAISAINYAVARGAKVINASWGGAVCSKTLKETIDKLAEQEVLFVVAAGNAGKNLDVDPEYPAAFTSKGQLTVAAVNQNGNMTAWSNSSFSLVNLAAPGDQIQSSVPTKTDNSGYAYLSGTSMAAPFVSGAAALLWSARPQASMAQIRQALLDGVDKGPYRVSSGGRLNVRKSLEALVRVLP